MTPRQIPRLVGPRGVSSEPPARISSSASLPPGLQKTAHRRVSLLTLFILVGMGLSFPLLLAGHLDKYTQAMVVHPLAIVIPLLACTAGLFVLSRIQSFSTQRLLDLALLFEVLLALGAGLGRHVIPWTEAYTRDWSEVAVLIIVFSVLIPNLPWKTAVATVAAGLMDPLGLAIGVANGAPMPDATLLGPMFGPTALAVILAIFMSRFIFHLGRRAQQARLQVRELGSYQLVEKLGSGGMGEIWLAEHRMLARPAAIKLITDDRLRPGSGMDVQAAVQRFEREAQATAQLQSEHTIHLYDYGVSNDGTCYYVMEHLEGLDVEELVNRYGSLPPERAVHLLLQACESLQEAHEARLVHRDIKPANLYLCRKGPRRDVIKVLDFGLVRRASSLDSAETRLTTEGQLTGTPAFVAPEAALGERELDGRADIYALGCVAWWMLTGKLVFEGDSGVKMMVAHIHQPPPPLSSRCEHPIPDALEECIQSCLAKDPADRPQTAEALAEMLQAIQLESRWTPRRAIRWWETHRPSDDKHRPIAEPASAPETKDTVPLHGPV